MPKKAEILLFDGIVFPQPSYNSLTSLYITLMYLEKKPIKSTPASKKGSTQKRTPSLPQQLVGILFEEHGYDRCRYQPMKGPIHEGVLFPKKKPPNYRCLFLMMINIQVWMNGSFLVVF